jgi:dihydrofolate reductase
MGKLILDISMSLDGFIAGPNPTLEEPLGRGREPLVMAGGTTFTFVTDGIEAALEQAKAAAGERDVALGGGASVAQQYLRAGLLDQLQVHVVPVLLGDGRRLFADGLLEGPELERTSVVSSPTGVTHLSYRVAN